MKVRKQWQLSLMLTQFDQGNEMLTVDLMKTGQPARTLYVAREAGGITFEQIWEARGQIKSQAYILGNAWVDVRYRLTF